MDAMPSLGPCVLLLVAVLLAGCGGVRAPGGSLLLDARPGSAVSGSATGSRLEWAPPLQGVGPWRECSARDAREGATAARGAGAGVGTWASAAERWC